MSMSCNAIPAFRPSCPFDLNHFINTLRTVDFQNPWKLRATSSTQVKHVSKKNQEPEHRWRRTSYVTQKTFSLASQDNSEFQRWLQNWINFFFENFQPDGKKWRWTKNKPCAPENIHGQTFNTTETKRKCAWKRTRKLLVKSVCLDQNCSNESRVVLCRERRLVSPSLRTLVDTFPPSFRIIVARVFSWWGLHDWCHRVSWNNFVCETGNEIPRGAFLGVNWDIFILETQRSVFFWKQCASRVPCRRTLEAEQQISIWHMKNKPLKRSQAVGVASEISSYWLLHL